MFRADVSVACEVQSARGVVVRLPVISSAHTYAHAQMLLRASCCVTGAWIEQRFTLVADAVGSALTQRWLVAWERGITSVDARHQLCVFFSRTTSVWGVCCVNALKRYESFVVQCDVRVSGLVLHFSLTSASCSVDSSLSLGNVSSFHTVCFW